MDRNEMLKPCPFCGSERLLMCEPTCRPETPYNPADRLYPIVRCLGCYAEAVGKNEDYRGTTAIAAWSLRYQVSPLPAGVVVKGLEWFGNDPNHFHSRGALFEYTIKHDGDEPDEWSVRRGGKLIAYHATEELARRAAEADYRTRILSALEPQGEEAVAFDETGNYGRFTPLTHPAPSEPSQMEGEDDGYVTPAETLLIYLRGCLSREDDDGMIDVPASYITDAIAILATPSKPVAVTDEMVERRDYLVWSNEHRAWWRANACGYARSILEAGRYTRADAVDIADKSRNGWKLDQRPDEIAVAIADLPPPIRAALEVLP